MNPDEPARTTSHWVRLMRRHHEGILLVAERALPVRFIIDGATGMLVTPLEGWISGAMDAALFAPEERRDALQLMVEVEAAEPSGAAQDRWAAYHGEQKSRHWGAMRVVGVRCEGEVCEDDELRPVNVLGKGEYRALRLLNADRAALTGVCERIARVHVPAPVAVGVDPHGIDVRASFGIVRVEFPDKMCGPDGCIECPDRAAAAIERLLTGASE